jgi:hypothetical protein
VATGVRGASYLLVFSSRTETLRRTAGLERVKPILEFFDTLESDFGFGLVQIRGKAQKRRFHRDVGPRLEGRIPRKGRRLREDQPTKSG